MKHSTTLEIALSRYIVKYYRYSVVALIYIKVKCHPQTVQSRDHPLQVGVRLKSNKAEPICRFENTMWTTRATEWSLLEGEEGESEEDPKDC